MGEKDLSSNRFKTFSPVFDKILGGGFPRRSLVLFEDLPGYAFSTIIASRTIISGIKNGEIGIYLTFDHSPSLIRDHVRADGLDVAQYEKSRKFFIIDGFRWGEKSEEYFIKDPSNDSELISVFSAIRDECHGGLTDNCRCLVDSTVSLFFVHGVEKLVSCALLLREISRKFGISSILLSIGAIGRRVNNVLGYNSDVHVEFKLVEEKGEQVQKMRVKRAFNEISPSPWVSAIQSGNEFVLKEE
jgi:KaiC/GvpD/RAD55 family RecA-like ATPase